MNRAKRAPTLRGQIQLRNEPEPGLDVEMAVTKKTVSLRTDNVELGTWQRASVHVARVSATKFDLMADGDSVFFLPEEPEVFAKLRFPKQRPTRRAGRRRERRVRRRLTTSRSQVMDPAPEAVPVSPAITSSAKESPKRRQRTLRRYFCRSGSWLWAPLASGLRAIQKASVAGVERLNNRLVPEQHQHSYRAQLAGAGLVRHLCEGCGDIRISAAASKRGDHLEGPGYLRP